MPDEGQVRRSQNDWRTLVRERLGALSLNAVTQEDVIAELASHLEDRVTATVRNGITEDEAFARALQEVPDWVALNQEISAAKKEPPMNDRTKMLWMPGMTMLIGSAILLFAILNLVPPAAWFHPQAPILFFGPWLFSYAVLGALGAYWSRRNGGSTAIRFLSGIFPVALHLTIFICVILASWLSSAPRFPEHTQFTFLVRTSIGFVLLPGIALALGALMFLRNNPSPTPMVAAGNR